LLAVNVSASLPLLRQELRADTGTVFLDRYGELIELSAPGQLAMRKLPEEHLKRADWDETRLPIRLRPFVPDLRRTMIVLTRLTRGSLSAAQ